MRTSSWTQYKKQAADIDAIDYYFAREFSRGVDLGHDTKNTLWFDCLVTLSYLQRQGHTCLDVKRIANTRLFVDEENLQSGISMPTEAELTAIIEQASKTIGRGKGLAYENARLYTERYWRFEKDIASILISKAASKSLSAQQMESLTTLWPHMFDTAVSEEQDWQQVATVMSVLQGVSIVNGGPGTGKTYTVTRILLALITAMGPASEVLLAAPTGKAAQRMTESIQHALHELSENELIASLSRSVPSQAQTLHRLLGVQRYGIGVKANEQRPLSCDVLIVDEASMIDAAMLTRLLRALKPDAKLILLGDADQLPSVESGNVLADIVAGDGQAYGELARTCLATLCPHLPHLTDVPNSAPRQFHITLQKSRRFSGQLGKCASAIRDGDARALNDQANTIEKGDMPVPSDGVSRYLDMPSMQDIQKMARFWFSDLLSVKTAQEGIALLSARRWLAATRQGLTGVESLNKLVELTLGVSPTPAGHYPGRPIMVTENFYPQGLFNGDIGIIWPDEAGKLWAWFEQGDGALRQVSLSRLPRVETVFAMTVHKSQGSEFNHVLMFLPVNPSYAQQQLCTRELLYTGVTRAKSSCSIVGTSGQLIDMVGRQVIRQTGLAQRISVGPSD